MKPRHVYGLALLGLAALVGLAWAGRGSFERVGPGMPAPSFDATTLDGEPRSIEDYRGEVVLLNVWATWCPPCKEEMPSMEALKEKVGSDDFRIVAVSIDARLGERDAAGRPGGDIGEFVDEYGLSFTILHNPSGSIQRTYGTTGVPESFLIDADGTILRRVVGPAEWDAPGYVDYVKRLLGEEVPGDASSGAGGA